MKANKNSKKKFIETDRLTSIASAIRTEGLGWVLRRLQYRTPFTQSGRVVHSALRRFLGLLLRVPRKSSQLFRGTVFRDETVLYAFYDLQVTPISYDASWFAVLAERERRKKGLQKIHFIVVPGTKDGMREERKAYEVAVPTKARIWRLYNIVMPILRHVPSFSGLSILPSRAAAGPMLDAAKNHVYPEFYETILPTAHWPGELLEDVPEYNWQRHRQDGSEIGILKSSPQGMEYIARWLQKRLHGRHLVTITIRNYNFMPKRNSNLESWALFANRLDSKKYLPVFVLDTEETLDLTPPVLNGCEVFYAASWDLALRMALYESSYLNLGVNNGPLFMCILNARTRVLIFKILTSGVPQTSEEFVSSVGFKIGKQLPFSTPFQRLVWEDDSLEAIEREFFKFVQFVDQNPKNAQVHF